LDANPKTVASDSTLFAKLGRSFKIQNRISRRLQKMARFQVRWINKRYLKKKEYRYKHYSIDFPAKQYYSALFFGRTGSSRRGEKITPTTTSILTLPEEAMRQKIRHLGLVVVDRKKKIVCSTTTTVQLVLPEELFSVEEALKLFAAISGLSGTVLGIFVGQKS
jgi:hypothetical protein